MQCICGVGAGESEGFIFCEQNIGRGIEQPQ